MKRPVFIIVGAIFVFVLLAIWLYMLFFGTPKNDPSTTFADLNFTDTTDTTVIVPDGDTTTDQPTVDIAGPERLRQLTTKPVVGHQEVLRDASSTPEVLYIEAGTGHVFSIDSTSGEETRLSGTTLRESQAGAITHNGRFVMIQSGSGAGKEFIVGEISSTSEILIPRTINENIVTFKATTDNTFLYAIQTDSSIIGKHYYPISDTSETIFTVPFREALIEWGDTALETHYTYPKANSRLEGFLYQIKNGQIERLPISGFGLSAQGNDSLVLYSKQLEGSYQTFMYDIEDNVTESLPIDIIPEKCTTKHKSSSKLICGETLATYGASVPDTWYKGIISYVDDLWEIEQITEGTLNASTIDRLVSPVQAVGRQLDMINLSVNKDDSNVYFINKNDRTLWLYELDTSTEEFNSSVDTPII